MIGELQTTIGHRVRAERRKTGLSQEKYGELLGYHRTYIGIIERGERNLTIQTVEDLAERLEVDVYDLLKPPR